MHKCFLSHSSKDKDRYVKLVYGHLGGTECIYDEVDFREGEKTLEEISKGLDDADLFVVFLSENSLESKWVKKEVLGIRSLLERGMEKIVFPIVIDPKISHEDPRIPSWMRSAYNLRPVSRPMVAARRIRERLREISWKLNPRLKEKSRLFVGRNEQIESIERRFDSFDSEKPLCVIASGLKGVGRKSFLRNALIKTGSIPDYFEFPKIVLSQQDGIEDLILKIADFGFSEFEVPTGLMNSPLDVKSELLARLLTDAQNAKQVILVEDDGCIVRFDRSVSEWVKPALEKCGQKARLVLAVSSKYRPNPSYEGNQGIIYTQSIPDLSNDERKRLFSRYLEFEGVSLSGEQSEYFCGLFNGYPEQIFYTVTLIKEEGLEFAKSKTDLIRDFNSGRAAQVVAKYSGSQDSMDLLYLLARFEFISFDFLFSLLGSREPYMKILEELFGGSICETLGSGGEYIRVNDVVRDYVSRSRLKLPEQFKERLDRHVRAYVKSFDDTTDVSDYVISIKEALKSGIQVDEGRLIPSHFLKTIKELYDQGRDFKAVIRLCERVLGFAATLERHIVRDIRYFYCQALARTQSDKFMDEIKFMDGADKEFLFGFYYRFQKRFADAIDSYSKALRQNPGMNRAKRELIIVYIYLEEYARGLELAKELYLANPNNGVHIQVYARCLLAAPDAVANRNLIQKLLSQLSRMQSDQLQEMYLIELSRYYCVIEGNKQKAIDAIDDAARRFPGNFYVLQGKFDIFRYFKDSVGMGEALNELRSEIKPDSYYYPRLSRLNCVYLASIGKKDDARRIVETDMRRMPQSTRESLLRIIDSY